MTLCGDPPSHNNLLLWRAARDARLRKLSPAARRIARRFGLDPETADILSALAGHHAGDRHE